MVIFFGIEFDKGFFFLLVVMGCNDDDDKNSG